MSNLTVINEEEKRREGGEEMPEGEGEMKKTKEVGEEEEKEGGDDPMTSLLVSELECPVCCSHMVGNIPAPLTAPAPAPLIAPETPPAPATAPAPSPAPATAPISCVAAPAPVTVLLDSPALHQHLLQVGIHRVPRVYSNGHSCCLACCRRVGSKCPTCR